MSVAGWPVIRRHGLFLVAMSAAVLGLIAGLAFVYEARSMPAYVDHGKAHALRNMFPPEYPPTDREDLRRFTRDWHEQMAALRTNKWSLDDRGRGLIALSLCAWAIIFISRLWKPEAWRLWRTPSRGWLWGSLLTTHFAALPAVAFATTDDLEREFLPHWGDTIAIPIFQTLLGTLLTSPAVIGVAWLMLRGARLPMSLWIWDAARPILSYLVTGTAAIIVAILLYYLLQTLLWSAPYDVPVLIAWIYLALCFRASFLSRNSTGIETKALS